MPSSRRGFANNFFYRSHLMWNRLPLSLREIIRPSKFKIELIKYIWTEFVFSVDSSSVSESEESDFDEEVGD